LKKWVVRLALVLAIVFFPSVPITNAVHALGENWLNGWGNRIEIVIDHNKIDANLTNFPILVHLSTSSGINGNDVSAVFDKLGSDANRKKIAVTTSDGVSQCYVEISYWSDANEQASLWVKVPSISATIDTILYFYYDAGQPDNTTYVGDTGSAPAQNVWDPNYVCVLHLAEQGNGTTGEYKDSTSYGNNGTGLSATKSPTETIDTEAINSVGIPCQSFAGDGTARQDGIYLADDDTLSVPIPGGFTFEVMLAPSKDSFGWAFARILNKNYGGNEWEMVQYANDAMSGSNPRYGWTDVYIYEPSAELGIGLAYKAMYTDYNWYLATGVITMSDSKHGTIAAYRNGDPGMSGSFTMSEPYTNSSSQLRLGYWDINNANQWYPGLMREVRISNTNRSAAWIKATYDSNMDSLISYVTEDIESPTAPIVVTLIATNVGNQTATISGNLTNMGGAGSVIVSFDYGTITSYGYSVVANESPLSGTGTFSANITGLLAHTTYHFRAKAVGAETSYGNDRTFTTKNVNNNPPVLNAIGNKTVNEGSLLRFTISATDPDGDTLTYSTSNLPSGANFNSSTRIFSWTPRYNQAGVYTVRFQVSDGELTDYENVTITVVQLYDDWDVNGDGVTNVLDITLVGQHWGESGLNGWIREDVNEDGTINVLDIIMIGQHLTE
jgi:hypothetical protein